MDSQRGPLPHIFALLVVLLRCTFVAGAATPRPQGAVLLNASRAPLSTSGRYIVDNQGARVKWACVNWYGAYSTTHVVGGLEVQPMRHIVNRIVETGFNCVRMMYSTEGYATNPPIQAKFLKANPELRGKRFLEIFDLAIEMLTDAGLMVIVNNHLSKSGWCCNYMQDEGLWYVPGYNESMWIDSLVFMANRYKDNPLVVGIDLRNEVHSYKDTYVSWGDGNPKTDWALAATKAGNAVLEVAPNYLIVVMAMCFGMDLRRMKDAPIKLMYPNRVVYQAHNYLEYQVFDNVAKQVGAWSTLRTAAFIIIAGFIILLGILRYVWVSAGKPEPPTGTVALSVGIWFSLVMAAGAVLSYNAYAFGMNFCSVAAETDVFPWFQGFMAVGAGSVAFSLYGAGRLYRGRRQARALAAATTPSDPVPSEGAQTVGQSVGVVPGDGSPPPASPRQEPGVHPSATVGPLLAESDQPSRPQPDGTSNPGLEASPNSAGWSASPQGASPTGQILSLDRGGQAVGGAGQGAAKQPAAKATEATGAQASMDPSERPPLCCCFSGCGACAQGWGIIFRATVRQLRHLVGLPPSPHYVVEVPAKRQWDVGMCWLLQISILLVLLILVLAALFTVGHIVPTYWWMERNLDGLWGFALEEHYNYTAPVWMGEFGAAVRGQYWLNFVRYLAIRDVDFAYWSINGLKWAEGTIDTTTGKFTEYPEPLWEPESFGILDATYDKIQHPWKLLDIQGLMPSPAAWQPDAIPCRRSYDNSCET